MRTNKALAYGLASLYYLNRTSTRWNRVEEISKFQGLSTSYCVKVLRTLVRAGFVASCGRGYRLKRDLERISVWALMESFIINFNGAPRIRYSRLPLNLHKTFCEATNHWLVGVTVQDIVEMAGIEKPQDIKARMPKIPALSLL